MLQTRMLAVLTLVFLLVPAVRAGDDADQEAVNRAHNFLKQPQRGRQIIDYVHFGTKYGGHQYKTTTFVKDGDGQKVRGHFALIYSFDWDRGGATDLAFLCDRRGNIYSVQVTKTNAVIAQPFVAANATIKILGNLLIEAFKEKMTDEQKKEVQKAVNDADARRMLELSLIFQQAFGG